MRILIALAVALAPTIAAAECWSSGDGVVTVRESEIEFREVACDRPTAAYGEWIIATCYGRDGVEPVEVEMKLERAGETLLLIDDAGTLPLTRCE